MQIENQKDFIDFNDIFNNKINNDVTAIKNKLDELSNLAISLYKNGISLETIMITLNNALNEIDSKNNLSLTKVLKTK